MSIPKHSSERGQSLVILALLFIAFAAILALVLDGGNAYAARRQAQNAADAGALAGASTMCETGDVNKGRAAAITYATMNGAVNPPEPEVDPNLAAGSVVVTATVQANTFFAGLIGINQVSPRAVAKAQCKPPVGMGVMPVAWSCRETVVEGEIRDIKCTNKLGPCPKDGKNGLSCTYILMDSVKVKDSQKGGKCKFPEITDPKNPDYCYQPSDIVCADPNAPVPGPNVIDCDLDNDGDNELMAGGARSWLDLNGGGGGASELSKWLEFGFPDAIPPHTWLPEQSGVATSIFKDAKNFVLGKSVILPVFDKVCDHYPNDITPTETFAACNVAVPPTVPSDDRTKAGNNMNFHVASFSKFHVTCVQTSKNKAYGEAWLNLNGNDSCPGHEAAFKNKSIDDNDKTIEGYFTEEQIYGYGGSGNFVDAGAFVVVLVR